MRLLIIHMNSRRYAHYCRPRLAVPWWQRGRGGANWVARRSVRGKQQAGFAQAGMRWFWRGSARYGS